MDLKIVASSLALLCVISKVACQKTCPHLVEYMWSFDNALEDHVIKTYYTLPEDRCLARCNVNKRCRSVNYNRKPSSSYDCQLNSATNQQYPKSYKQRPGWLYFENKIADSLPPVVDGSWGEWGPWSFDCSTDCLQEKTRNRKRKRTRTCSNPAPQGDGLDCEGENTESRICGTSGCFELFQSFQINDGTTVISFVLEDELFIAFGSSRASSGLYKTKLPVYVLQKNNFTMNQTLDSFSVFGVEYFTINCNHFLVVANQYNNSRNSQDRTVVHRWEAGEFKKFQLIPTNRVTDTHYFAINTRKFVSFSNNQYGRMKVSIYEWKNEKLSDKIQDIQITYAFRCNTFTIHNITYITCGKGWARRNAVTVLKWSGKQFEPFQDLPSSNVEGRPHIFHANGTVYLAIANFQSPVGYNPDTDSFIYRWNGIKFVHHQSIPTHGAMGWDSFSTAAGEVFLVVANRYTQGYREKAKSAVYKMANNKFNLYQKLPTTWPKYLHAFTHKGKQYLAVTTQVNIIKRAESSVYIWN